MAISGRIAAASRMGLEDLLERKLLEEKMDAARRQQAIENAMREREMGMRDRDFTFRESEAAANRAERDTERTRRTDAEAGEKRTLGNMAGVVEMMGSGLDPETARREIAMTGLRGGVEPPRMIEGLMPVKKEPKFHPVTTRGVGGKPLRKLVSEEELQRGVEEFREPKQGPASEGKQWVIRRDGQQAYRVPQPGDKKYDPVSERQPKDAGPSPYSTERAHRTVTAVDDLIGRVSGWTAGYGSLLANIPETDATDFAADLDELKANIAFNELTEMREASKTGGALGQVSNIELGLLQSALGGLDTKQKPESLRRNLQQIKKSVERYQQARSLAAGTEGKPKFTATMPGESQNNDPLGIRRPK